MYRFTRTLAYAAAASAVTLGVSAIPADAASPAESFNVSCSTTGAIGHLQVDWKNGHANQNVVFSLSDSLSDGHAVEIRVIGEDQVGGPLSWPWHKLTTGYGTGHTWTSTATFSRGIYDIGLEVARYSGSGTILNYCTKELKDGI